MSQYCKITLSISDEMVGVYVGELMRMTSVDLNTEEEEQDEMFDVLEDYCAENNEDISTFFNVDGVDLEQLQKAGARTYSIDYILTRQGHGRTSENLTVDKVVLAIPPQVGAKIFGNSVRDWIYVGIVQDNDKPINIVGRAQKTDDQGNPIQEFEKKIVVGAYTHRDNIKTIEAVEKTMVNKASEAIKNFWRDSIRHKLSEAARDPSRLEAMLRDANREANEQQIDNIDVSTVKDTSVRIAEGQGECDFVAFITSYYTYSAKPADGQKEKAKTPQQQVEEQRTRLRTF